MLKNKLFESVQKYLDQYLFGFDSSQLDMSILKGNINLSNVNLRPDKVNQMLQAMMIPFALKAGTIGKLDLKVSLLQMWTGPIEVTIDELFVIMGPNVEAFVSHDDSYIRDDDDDNNLSQEQLHARLLEPYDPSNMFNIFENQLKLKQKQPVNTSSDSQQQQQQQEQQACQIMEKATLEFLKNLKLVVNKVHMRYEDDSLSGAIENPYSFGIVIHNFTWESGDQMWKFDSSSNGPKLIPVNRELSQVEHLLKNITITNMSAYWSTSETGGSSVMIPTSLWESTKHLEQQIFEAIDINDLKSQMMDQDPTYSTMGFSLYTNSAVHLSITPQIVSKIDSLTNFCENFFILRDLKQYRPHRKPLTNIPKVLQDHPIIKRKRRLLVRDWFYYVVWFVRLRRIVKGMHIEEELLQIRLEQDQRYREIVRLLEDPQANLKGLKQVLDSRKRSLNQEEQTNFQPSVWVKSCNIRLPLVKVDFYQNHNNLKQQHDSKVIECEIQQFGFDNLSSFKRHNLTVSSNLSLSSFTLSTLSTNDNIQSLPKFSKTKQLSIATTVEKQPCVNHIPRASHDYECSPTNNQLESKVSEILSQHQLDSDYQNGSGSLRLNQVFRQDHIKFVSKENQGHQGQDSENNISFLSKFNQKMTPSSNNPYGNPQPAQLMMKQQMIQRMQSPQIYGLDGTNSASKPPMPQANMKRSLVMASKGDIEQPTSMIQEQQQEESLLGNVFNKVINMIGVNNENSRTIDQLASKLVPPAILTRAFASQNEGTKGTRDHQLQASNIIRPGSALRSNTATDQHQVINSSRTAFSNHYSSGLTNHESGSQLQKRVHTSIHIDNGAKCLTRVETNSSRAGPAKSGVDIHSMISDPVHQFMMSDLSINQLKQNLQDQGAKILQAQKSHEVLDIPANSYSCRETPAILDQTNGSQYLRQQFVSGNQHPQSRMKKSDILLQKSATKEEVKNSFLQTNSKAIDGSHQIKNEQHHLFNKSGGAHYTMINNRNHGSLKQQNNMQQTTTVLSSKLHHGNQKQVVHDQPQKKVFLRLTHAHSNNHYYQHQHQSNSLGLSINFERHQTQQSQNSQSSLKGVAKIGNIAIDYDNEVLESLVSMMLAYQKSSSLFREILRFEQNQGKMEFVKRVQPPSKMIDLMMPLYILKKIVMRNQVKEILKTATSKGNQYQDYSNQQQWDDNLEHVERYLKTYNFDLTLDMARMTIVVDASSAQNKMKNLCKFSSPENMICRLYKNEYHCGFDILGFTLSGCQDLQLFSLFAQSFQTQLNLFKQHPAISQGLNYIDLKKKESQRHKKSSKSRSRKIQQAISGDRAASRATTSSLLINDSTTKNCLDQTTDLKVAMIHQGPNAGSHIRQHKMQAASRPLSITDKQQLDYGKEYLMTEQNATPLMNKEDRFGNVIYAIDNLSAKDSEARNEEEMFLLMQQEDEDSSTLRKPPVDADTNTRGNSRHATQVQPLHFFSNESDLNAPRLQKSPGAAAAVAVVPTTNFSEQASRTTTNLNMRKNSLQQTAPSAASLQPQILTNKIYTVINEAPFTQQPSLRNSPPGLNGMSLTQTLSNKQQPSAFQSTGAQMKYSGNSVTTKHVISQKLMSTTPEQTFTKESQHFTGMVGKALKNINPQQTSSGTSLSHQTNQIRTSKHASTFN